MIAQATVKKSEDQAFCTQCGTRLDKQNEPTAPIPKATTRRKPMATRTKIVVIKIEYSETDRQKK